MRPPCLFWPDWVLIRSAPLLIAAARNYPAMLLNRDKYIPEITKFKNREDKLIVLYDDDERQAVATATTFMQKGFDNIFILSHGMQRFMMYHPEYVVSTVPLDTLMPPQAGSMAPSSRRGSGRPPRGSGRGGAQDNWDTGSIGAGSVSYAGSVRGSDFGSQRR